MSRPRTTRRGLLGAVGAGTAMALAGCSDVSGSEAPDYDPGEVTDADGEGRSAEEMVTAEALAETEPNEGVTTLQSLSLESHEFVLEDGYLGSTVQGVVENVGDDRVQLVEVRVRLYNDDGEQIGHYLDVGGDLDPGTRWSFQVILLKPPADIADYDIALVGTPA